MISVGRIIFEFIVDKFTIKRKNKIYEVNFKIQITQGRFFSNIIFAFCKDKSRR